MNKRPLSALSDAISASQDLSFEHSPFDKHASAPTPKALFSAETPGADPVVEGFGAHFRSVNRFDNGQKLGFHRHPPQATLFFGKSNSRSLAWQFAESMCASHPISFQVSSCASPGFVNALCQQKPAPNQVTCPANQRLTCV
jgi:hypothetical protein